MFFFTFVNISPDVEQWLQERMPIESGHYVVCIMRILFYFKPISPAWYCNVARKLRPQLPLHRCLEKNNFLMMFFLRIKHKIIIIDFFSSFIATQKYKKYNKYNIKRGSFVKIVFDRNNKHKNKVDIVKTIKRKRKLWGNCQVKNISFVFLSKKFLTK